MKLGHNGYVDAILTKFKQDIDTDLTVNERIRLFKYECGDNETKMMDKAKR